MNYLGVYIDESVGILCRIDQDTGPAVSVAHSMWAVTEVIPHRWPMLVCQFQL